MRNSFLSILTLMLVAAGASEVRAQGWDWPQSSRSRYYYSTPYGGVTDSSQLPGPGSLNRGYRYLGNVTPGGGSYHPSVGAYWRTHQYRPPVTSRWTR